MGHFSEKYLSGTRTTKAVYGIVLITAALISFQLHEHDPAAIALKIFLAAIVIVAAEVYAEFLGEKIRLKRSLSKQERREIVDDTMVISSVSLYPVVVFLLSATHLYDVEVAFMLSYLLSLIGLGAFGYLASRSAGMTREQSIVRASIAVAIGLAVIMLKYSFGH